MKDFAAIDFETANFEQTSVCAVGVVVYRNGERVDDFYSLIKPEPEYYNAKCSSVNGLKVAIILTSLLPVAASTSRITTMPSPMPKLVPRLRCRYCKAREKMLNIIRVEVWHGLIKI